MDVRNCRSCRRLFNYVTGPLICPVCREKNEEKFQAVKEYIRDHKGAGMQEVAEVCEVELSMIQQWLREDRLEVTEGSAIMLNCEGCGAPIRSGRFCDKCRYDMTAGFNNALKSKPRTEDQESERDKSRMRFLREHPDRR